MTRKRKVLLFFLVVLVALGLWLGYRYHALGLEVHVDTANLPADPPAPVATEFSVVSYNVQARPLMDDSVYKFARMPKLLNAYDVVAVQEMWHDQARMFAGWTFPVKLYLGTLNTPFKVTGAGLGIGARFRLEQTEGWSFSTAGELQNVPASKGVLFARFLVGGLPLDVFTTHMEAGHKTEYSDWARRKQGEELVAFVKAHTAPEHALILLGDFNMRHSKAGQEDARLAAGQVVEHFDGLTRSQVLDAMTTALGVKDLDLQITGKLEDSPDHIFYRSGTKAALTPLSFGHDDPAFYDENKQPLSDHTPMFGRFRIAPAG